MTEGGNIGNHNKRGDQMNKLSVTLGVVLTGLSIFGYAEVWGVDWKLYNSTEKFMAYYDAQSITHPSKNIVRVWASNSWTEKGIKDMVGSLGKKFKNVTHSTILWEINCVEKKYHYLAVTSYSNKGDVIYFDDSSPTDWDFIIPESLAGLLYKKVCK
jgi:hypothetical protein